MPQGILRWDQGGTLTHHCPGCDRPLSNARARSKCLGEHVECCKAFHPRLYAIGCNATCTWCDSSEKIHGQRCRIIAEQRREVLKLRSEEDPPMSPEIVQCYHLEDQQDSPIATTKRQRKELKKAEKAAQHAIAITDADIAHVVAILYPSNHNEDRGLEHATFHDQDVLHNLSFHPNTCQGRDLRRELIAHDREMGEYNVPDQVILDRMDALGVKDSHCPKNSEERKLLDHLKETIQKELVSTGKERQETMKRRAAFLRWANKNGYKKLVDRQKGACLPKEEAEVAEDDNTINVENYDNTVTLPADDDNEASTSGASTDDDSLPSLTSTATTHNEDGVLDDSLDAARAMPVPPPTPAFKFYHNNGLHHLKSTPNLRKECWKPC